VVARNELFAETKQSGYGGKKFVLFTSAHCHYSLQKAAQICGFGSSNARSVPVDEQGRMRVDKLREMIREARHEGYTPFFVNATAGTTVLGAFDPLVEIARVCREEKLWFHIDASWGGSAIFSSMHKHKMRGSELADSLTINPHKMMGVPVTCSFLLTSDTRRFWRANTLPAGYLFHGNDVPESGPQQDRSKCSTDGDEHAENAFWDLADLTLQCGRKGDSLKLALAWVYYGRLGFENQIDHAFHMAAYFASLIAVHVDLVLISENPPPCLQVCFYYARGSTLDADEAVNSRRTQEIARGLVSRGFMVDYAPGDRGFFLRPVIHLMTTKSTVEGLLKAVVELGNSIR
jgi:glutamate/tyrosine decarboxylase-like PLP-dependent enzyme